MSAQLDMFPTELSAEPNTNSDLVGLAVRRQFRAREFAIIVTELSGNKTELCRVGSNPEAVAEGARRKTILLGRSRRIPLYRRVEVVELKP
jgi:hypothetical protein